MKFDIVKGTRVRAQWLQANDPPSSLAGMQMKLGVTERTVEGVVTHIRADHPLFPTRYEVHVRPDGQDQDIVLKPEWIREVIPTP